VAGACALGANGHAIQKGPDSVRLVGDHGGLCRAAGTCDNSTRTAHLAAGDGHRRHGANCHGSACDRLDARTVARAGTNSDDRYNARRRLLQNLVAVRRVR
jgi:hypothetical protein